MWRKGKLLALLVGMQTGAATVEKTVWSFLIKLKIELFYDPGITLLSIYPQKFKNAQHKGIHAPCVYFSIITIANYGNNPSVC